MKTSNSPEGGIEPQVADFINALLDRAAALRLPELCAGKHAGALWWVPSRHGVTVVALRTTSLSEEQRVKIMTYRLAQYVMARELDPRMIYDARLEHEPLSNVSEADIHFIGCCSATGEILCYITLEAIVDAGYKTLSSDERRLFPVETVFGPGVFRRLRILPDLPVARIRELGRFVKNQQKPPLDELTARATVEVIFGMFSLMRGPLRQDVDAGIGDIEENVAKKNLDFFHVPTAVIHGVVPYAADGSFGFFNYQYRTRYPFAFLSSDISKARLVAIEAALELPGKQGIMALMALKRDLFAVRSNLEPSEGLTPLTEAAVPQQGVAMADRRRLLELGDRLRHTSLFGCLSVAEAAVLGTFLERCAATEGDTIVRQGDAGDDLYLIESGRVEVQVVGRNGRRTVVATLGPGDCFGEIALVTGGERTADVIALTPVTLLRLNHDAYARYLAHMVEVESALTRTAVTRAHETLQAVRRDDT